MPIINEIKHFDFNESGLSQLKVHDKGVNWPVVYLIHDEDNLYIGETTSAAVRMSQHLKNDEKKNLKGIEIIFDGRYNKSVILDYEQRLIKYCSVDGRFKKIINKNKGQQAIHDYYQREQYRSQFRILWKELLNKNLAKNSLDIIENENIFKFSPYNALTGEQNEVSISIINDIVDTFENDNKCVSLINGCAGTGKTVLAISIINSIVNAINIDDSLLDSKVENFEDDIDENKRSALLRLKKHISVNRGGKPFKVGFVFPMPGIRATVKKVFRDCGNGLVGQMVIGPTDVVKDQYDILFVDESHRLSKRKNLTGYKSFDDTCRKLGLEPNSANQLDWIINSAKHVVLFYDQTQTVKSSDLSHGEYKETLEKYKYKIHQHKLKTQMRCEGGDIYLQYIKDVMSCLRKKREKIENYDFFIFDNVNTLVESIRKKDDEMGLCKTVAGFSWEWKTKPNNKPKDDMEYYNTLVQNGEYDILIDGNHYIWNLTNDSWVTRQDSHNTIGCIHTTQGYDMNYVGVIFGKEIDYDFDTKSIVVNLDEYKDSKVKAGTDENTLKKLIMNTYTTILARGIKGCYVYACNPNMQKYLKEYIFPANDITMNNK